MSPVTEPAAVLALVNATKGEWHTTAAVIEDAGSAVAILDGRATYQEPGNEAIGRDLASCVRTEDVDTYARLIAEMRETGAWIVTVLDQEYPWNLRQIYNLPPFLFVRGRLDPSRDERAIAVVGTRQASDEGVTLAREISAELAAAGVVVLSGLAKGIDSAAHEACLDAGGRTIGVMGTGITRIYPSESGELAHRIVREGGACVSQFWPTQPPTKISFPMRNITMSGMSMGTVVVEAGETSGARRQAREATQHGKRLFLVRSLLKEDWARRYAERPNTTIIDGARDVIAALESMEKPAEQLRLA